MKIKIILGAATLLCAFLETSSQENNVCPTYVDYYSLKINTRCFYDFTVSSSVPDIITGYGYPLEIHNVTSRDGYILTLFRMPNQKALEDKKDVIFLQHGLGASSADFFGNNNNSIGFLLYDAGYEIWIGNTRGCEYSNKHVNLTVTDNEYWNYSLDDVTQIDQPALMEYVAQETGQKGNIIYIGHSLGTTLPLMYTSGMPEHSKGFIKFMFLLAPAATLANMISPLKLVTPFGPKILKFVNRAQLVVLASDGLVQRDLLSDICFSDPFLMKGCMDMINTFYGPFTQMPANKVHYFLMHYPSGISIKSFAHAATFALNNFRMFDYGSSKNMEVYGASEPPNYDVSKIEIPMYIFAAKNDWACTAKDAKILYSKLSPKYRRGIDIINLRFFNHVDFLYGKDAIPLVYNKILDMVRNVENWINRSPEQ